MTPDANGRSGGIVFPTGRLPEDPGQARLVGLYAQRGRGLWMQRVKVPGGRLTARQWRMLGRIAEELVGGGVLHLTTRQDVELHDLTARDIPDAQRMLDQVDLDCIGACGDTLRNVTVCPCSGVRPGSADLAGLGREIRRTLAGQEGIYSLPRKFKISLSCTASCGQPWINDLGFVARWDGAERGFTVIGAGSLGAQPATGIVLFDWLAAADVLPMVVSAVRLFAAHGDRRDRRRARFRHIRQRMGDKAFLELLIETFEAVKAEGGWPQVSLDVAGDEFPSRRVLTFPNGDISVASAEALASLAERDDIRVRIACDHRVIVFGGDAAQLDEAVASRRELCEAARPQAAVVACPGTRWCKRAMADTNNLADRLRTELAGQLPADAVIRISGCPNGCAHSAVAEIGLRGGLRMREGHRQETYDLSVGGGMGRDGRMAKQIAQGLTAEQVIGEVARQIR